MLRLKKCLRPQKQTLYFDNSNVCFEIPSLYSDKSNLSNCSFP